MPVRMQFRRGTATQWTSANPVLAQGELGLETDTAQIKVGDGTTDWSGLGYGGIIGPTGATGSQGPQGPTGAGSVLSRTVLLDFSQNVVEVDVSSSSLTASRIATYAVPSGMKGKTGFLTGYFYLSNQTVWASNTTVSYGFALDSTLLATIGGNLLRYTHTASSNNILITANPSVVGTGGLTTPLTIPVSVPSNASNFYAVVSNSSIPFLTTQQGAVTTTTFVGNGSIQTYTVPANITSIRVYLWGAGGLGQNKTPDTNPTAGNAGGSAAYISGIMSVTPGQVLYLIIGRSTNSTSQTTGWGGLGYANNSGGGFTGIFNSSISGLSASATAAYLVACASGGGGGGTNNTSYTGGGGGVTTGKTAPSGGTGGTQTAGGTGAGANGSLLQGGSASGNGGGGGSGYYGGGCPAGGNPTAGGGGGSSYIGALLSVLSEDGATPTSTTSYSEPGGAATMRSFFGASAWYGASGNSGAAVIVTQGTYPTYIGSEVSVVY
jgi:hypothetical protein